MGFAVPRESARPAGSLVSCWLMNLVFIAVWRSRY